MGYLAFFRVSTLGLLSVFLISVSNASAQHDPSSLSSGGYGFDLESGGPGGWRTLDDPIVPPTPSPTPSSKEKPRMGAGEALLRCLLLSPSIPLEVCSAATGN